MCLMKGKCPVCCAIDLALSLLVKSVFLQCHLHTLSNKMMSMLIYILSALYSHHSDTLQTQFSMWENYDLETHKMPF